MPTFIIQSCFPSFGFKVTQWDMYVEKDFNRLFCGDCRQAGFSRSTPIKVVFLQFKPEFDTAECVQCWLRPTGMNAPVADPHLTAAFLTTWSFHTPLLLNVLLMVAPVGGLQMHSLTIHVTEAQGSNSAGLHTGFFWAARYWVMTHFPHFNLGENSPQCGFFFLFFFSSKLGQDLHKVE